MTSPSAPIGHDSINETPDKKSGRRRGSNPSSHLNSPASVAPVSLLPSTPNHVRTGSSGLAVSSPIPPDSSPTLQSQVLDASRRLEVLLKKLDADSVAQIKQKQVQLKQLQGKVDDAISFKSSLDHSIEDLQRWLREINEQKDILDNKLAFLKDLGSLSLVERNILANDTREFLATLATSDASTPKPAEAVDWIIPGMLCQMKTLDDASWVDAVVSSAEMENRVVLYSLILIGSGKIEKVRASCIRPVQETKPKLRQTQSTSFFPRWR